MYVWVRSISRVPSEPYVRICRVHVPYIASETKISHILDTYMIHSKIKYIHDIGTEPLPGGKKKEKENIIPSKDQTPIQKLQI